jgi:hypothetical protein
MAAVNMCLQDRASKSALTPNCFWISKAFVVGLAMVAYSNLKSCIILPSSAFLAIAYVTANSDNDDSK